MDEALDEVGEGALAGVVEEAEASEVEAAAVAMVETDHLVTVETDPHVTVAKDVVDVTTELPHHYISCKPGDIDQARAPNTGENDATRLKVYFQ